MSRPNTPSFWTTTHTTSEKDEWETPRSLVSYLAQYFSWDLDVCASRANVCETFLTKADNALSCSWTGLCWNNPPYGKEMRRWIAKAKHAAQSPGTTVVCLVPARTDTKWWHHNVPEASLVVFLKGRLSFELDNIGQPAPFPSAIIVFGPLSELQKNVLKHMGWSPLG